MRFLNIQNITFTYQPSLCLQADGLVKVIVLKPPNFWFAYFGATFMSNLSFQRELRFAQSPEFAR